MTIETEFVGPPRRLRYRFAIDVPVHDDQRIATLDFASFDSPAQTVIHLDGPPCLRHRWPDGSLCMWLDSDPPDHRWVPDDGLLALVGHVEQHAYGEAECRAGRDWPKPESPGGSPTSPDLSVMLFSALTLEVSGPAVGAIIAFAGVLVGLLVNGDRAERQRRRELHSRALGAVLAYGEMPFMIRRRKREDSESSAERVRLSDHFSQIKAEVSACQVLLDADGDENLASAYGALVEVARQTAGHEAHEAWNQPAVATDPEMNMGDLFEKLEGFRQQVDLFTDDLARATLPRRKRMRRWFATRVRRSTSTGTKP
jgi:hypothetical protein